MEPQEYQPLGRVGSRVGGDVTIYGVPEVLKPTHGDHPFSLHLFVRLRPPAPMGSMTDAVMTRIMR